jgi:hypothetical protein
MNSYVDGYMHEQLIEFQIWKNKYGSFNKALAVVKDPPTAKLLTMSPRTASIPLCDKE